MLTQGELEGMFYYLDGTLRYQFDGKHGVREGDRAGYPGSNGYRIMRIDGKRYYEHRVIFLLCRGFIPPCLDHKNRDRSDNRIENLRPATGTQNQGNSTKQQGCSSKFKGVCKVKDGKGWIAQIVTDGKHTYLGSFSSEKAAGFAYNLAANRLFGEYAKLNKI